MAKSETLSVTLDAKDETKSATTSAKTNMDKLAMAAKNSSERMASSLGAIKGMMAFSFLGNLGTQLKNTTVAFAAQMDTISKNARVVGMSVAEYQKLNYAFEMQGVSSDTMYASFKRFNIVLGDLKNGQGALGKQLASTNPALLAQLKGAKSTSEAFLIAAEAVKSQGDASLKSAMAMDLFGKSGVELNKVFEAGADGLGTLMSEQGKYGTLTDKQAGGAETFLDSMSRLQTSFKAMSNALLAQMMPALTQLFESLAAGSQKFKPVLAMLSGLLGIIIKLAPVFLSLYGIMILVNTVMFLNSVYTKVASTGLLALLKSTKLFTAAQIVLNAVMAVNPIVLIAAGVAVAIIALMLLIKHFDKVKMAMMKLGNTIKYIFSGQWFKGFFEGIKAFVLHPIDSMLEGFRKLWGWINIFDKKKKDEEQGVQPSVEPGGQTPLEMENATGGGSVAGGMASQENTRSTVDVNFNNLPKGTLVNQSKPVANVNFNLGFTR